MHFFIRVKAERRHDGFGKLMGADREQLGSIEEQDLCLHGVFGSSILGIGVSQLALPRGIVAHCPRHCSTCAARAQNIRVVYIIVMIQWVIVLALYGG